MEKTGIKHLKFHSDVLLNTDRFSKDFYLEDYKRTADGKFSKEETLKTIMDSEYGYVEAEGLVTTGKVVSVSEHVVAGKARRTEFEITMKKGDKQISFPLVLHEPYKAENAPLIVYISFSSEDYCNYLPMEELMDNGVKIAYFDYTTVSRETYRYQFDDLLSGMICDRNTLHPAGKIAVWAYATRKVAWFLYENGYGKRDNIYVAGHSRLGKTALVACANDDIFSGCLSNCSGAGGSAIYREKGEKGEKIHHFEEEGVGCWFSTDLMNYKHKDDQLPYDQHYLLASIAPRKLCITLASNDHWGDLYCQYVCVEAASEAYKELGYKGLENKGFLKTGDYNKGDRLAIKIRDGEHFLSREDWKFFIDFIKE